MVAQDSKRTLEARETFEKRLEKNQGKSEFGNESIFKFQLPQNLNFLSAVVETIFKFRTDKKLIMNVQTDCSLKIFL